MSAISIQHYIEGALANAGEVKLSDSGATYGIKNAASGATIISPTSAITPTSTGVYSYDTSALAAGSYVASWKITNGGNVDYYLLPFRVDAIEVGALGCTLRQVEQETARRVGPYYSLSATSGTASSAVVARLQSTLAIGDYDDLFILRRGLYAADFSPVIGFAADDRVRRVASYTPGTGTLVPDRNWATGPVSGELVELVYLDPENLTHAVKAGLRRCALLDTVNIALTATAAERNLTASIPWLTRATQLRRVEAQSPSSTVDLPYRVSWHEPVVRQGQLYVRIAPDPYPNTLIVTALRPASTLVNGVTSLGGPTDDSDVLAIPVEYAAAAGHVECWRYHRALLNPAARAGLVTPLEDAARLFTKESQRNTRMIADNLRVSDPFGWRDGAVV